MITFLVARPEKPLDLSTMHDGPLHPESPYIVNGIRTKIGEHLIRNAGLSSPFRPMTPPTRADSFAVPA